MRVNIVCTGNVARSAALGILLAELRPDLVVDSSAVGLKAKAGRRMAKPMRELMAFHGFGVEAEAHRSQIFYSLPTPDYVVATAPVHVRRLDDWSLLYPAPIELLDPPIPDPAFGGREAYEQVWPMLIEAASYLRQTL